MSNYISAPVAAQPQDVDLEPQAWAGRGFDVLPATWKKAPAAGEGGWDNASSDPVAVAAMPWKANKGRMGVRLGDYTLPDGRKVCLFGFDLDAPKHREMTDADWSVHPLGLVFFGLVQELQGGCIVQRTPRGRRLFCLLDAMTTRTTGGKAMKHGDGAKLEFLSKGGALVTGTIYYDPAGDPAPAAEPGGRQGTYTTREGGALRLDQLAVLPAARLNQLQHELDAAKKRLAAAPVAATPAGSEAGFMGLGGAGRGSGDSGGPAALTLLPSGEVAPLAPEQSLPAHIADAAAGGAPRQVGRDRPSNPAEVREALLAAIAAAKGAGEDTAGMDFWLGAVLLPLAGAVARDALPEDEARAIFDAASAACGGATDQNDKQWAGAIQNAREKLGRSENVMGAGSIFEKAKAAGWVAPGSITSPSGEAGHGGVRQGAGRKVLTTPDLIAQMAGQPLAFGYNARTGEHTFDLTAPIPGVALGVGRRQRVDDTAARQVAVLLAGLTGKDITPQKAIDVMQTAGDANHYDPVKEMLAALATNNPWDGTPRLDTWLSAYCGALDTPLHRQWGRLTVLALIARICTPGCKWDHVLTLVGGQGAGKSTVARIMAFDDDANFTDHPVLGLDAKELIETTRGRLIVEMCEMARGRAREVENDKAMIPRTHDEARMAYDRRTTRLARGFIFIGTTNDGQFLQDVTGNRRWWPVKVGIIDTAALRRDWPQIVVEAMRVFATEFGADAARVRLDPQWYGQAEAAQEAFTAPDEIATDIEGVLRATNPTDGAWAVRRITVGGGLRISHDDLRCRLESGSWGRLGPQRLGKEINRVMPKLGWEPAKNSGQRQWIQPDGWAAPASPPPHGAGV